ATTSAEICIINQNTAGSGNDFVMDDISFAPVIESASSGDSVLVLVNSKPNISLADTTICAGDVSGKFDAGSGFTSYTWSGKGTGTSQTTSRTVAGVYTVSVVDVNGCKDTAFATLTINAKPTITLADTTLCSGDVAGAFNAGNGFTSYAWSGKGTGTAQSTPRTSAGLYTVSVVDANGCKDTASATLTFNTKPTITLSDTTICAGDKAGVFSVAAQFASYAWSGNGTGNSPSTVRANAGVYNVSVIDANGCKDTASATLTINTKPNVILSNDTICEGDAAVTFDAGAGYSSYLWSGSGTGNAQTISTALAGTYTVEVVNANGCKDTASAVLKVNQKPNVNFASLPPVCIDLPLLALKGGTPLGGIYEIQYGSAWQRDSVVEIKKKAAGSYAIRYTYRDANSCVNTASTSLVINNLPTLNIADQEICEGESATFDAGTTFQKYLWSTGWNQKSISTSKAGTYGVLVTDANGCITGDTMNLTVNALPMVDLGADQKVCDGEVVVLSSVAPAASYLWSDGSSNAQLNVNKSGKYSLTVTDSKGCKNSDQVEVNVVPLPVVDLGDDQEICEGDSATLLVSDTDATYVWSTGEKSSAILVGSSQSIILSQYYDTQCMVRDTAIVVVVPYPVSALGNDTTVCFGETLGGALTLEASNFADNILWSDGSTNSNIAVSAKGTYSVTMTNGKNCTTNDEIKVNEFCKTSIFMPNAFTPNNDGTNDVFYVEGMYVEDFHLLIFNRWGEVVFESFDINNGWDGTVLGDKAQIDVYVVKLFYKENTEWGSTSKNEMISSLTLIR
ncbi:MAG: gliding motility-associated C-terminal domain-containing protein, partial [Flavobacteriales bacterium]